MNLNRISKNQCTIFPKVESQPHGHTASLLHLIHLSTRSFESSATANVDHGTHQLVTNFYDRSEQGFKYDIQIEVSRGL